MMEPHTKKTQSTEQTDPYSNPHQGTAPDILKIKHNKQTGWVEGETLGRRAPRKNTRIKTKIIRMWTWEKHYSFHKTTPGTVQSKARVQVVGLENVQSKA